MIRFEDLDKKGKEKLIKMFKEKIEFPKGVSLEEYFKDNIHKFRCPFCNSDKVEILNCKEVGCKGCMAIHFRCQDCKNDRNK